VLALLVGFVSSPSLLETVEFMLGLDQFLS
jgi:hypothetical protein